MVLAKANEVQKAAALTLVLSLVLSFGFLPTANRLGLYVPSVPREYFFPILAFLFWMSLGSKRGLRTRGMTGGELTTMTGGELTTMTSEQLPAMTIWMTVPVPLLAAVVFGAFVPEGDLIRNGMPTNKTALLWFVLFAPFGEELLFRGWFYRVIESLWGKKVFPMTNGFSLPIWGSSIAFSLWHLQNLGRFPLPFVVWQVSYTLIVGLWLGMLREKSGGITLPLLCHVALNFCANLL